MACQITILTIDAYGSAGQPVQSIVVHGSATECAAVDIQISCAGHEYAQSVSVTAGLWQATFTSVECLCDGTTLRVSARCKANPACLDSRSLPLICQPHVECPELGEITADPAGPCYRPADKITLSVAVHDPYACLTQYVWVFTKQPGQCSGGSNPSCPGAPAPSSIVKLTTVPSIIQGLAPADGFSEGNWTAQVIADPSDGPGCGDCQPVASAIHPFSILQPGSCPQVEDITVTLVSTSGGEYTYQFTASFSGNTGEARVSWDFGNGPTAVQCLCGATVAQSTHSYPTAHCGQVKTVAVILEPGNGCCTLSHQQRTFQLPSCGGNGGGGHHPCPWWHPKCWKFKCNALLVAALAALAAAAALAIVAGCTGTPALWVASAASFAVGLGLLAAWVTLCSKVSGDFCSALHDVILGLAAFVAVQGTLLAILAALGVTLASGCGLGLAVSFAYYGTVLAYLIYVEEWKC